MIILDDLSGTLSRATDMLLHINIETPEHIGLFDLVLSSEKLLARTGVFHTPFGRFELDIFASFDPHTNLWRVIANSRGQVILEKRDLSIGDSASVVLPTDEELTIYSLE